MFIVNVRCAGALTDLIVYRNERVCPATVLDVYAEFLRRYQCHGDENAHDSLLKKVYTQVRRMVSGVIAIAVNLVNWLFSLW